MPFVDRLADSTEPRLPDERPDLRGYVDIALRSGFPEAALKLSDMVRSRWLDSYVDQLVTRDAEQLDGGRDPERFRRYFEALTLNTAGVAAQNTIYESAGINRRTAAAYDQLLKNLLVLDPVPAWTSNRVKRLVRTPKQYLADVGLMVGALGIDVDAVMRDGDLLGRVLDTFVASQLRAQATVSRFRPRLFHLRTAQGRHEVDLVIELRAQRIIGVEVKATASPGQHDAKHLEWLRDEVGDRFARGVILHTGPRQYRLGDRIDAIPICALWC